MFFAVQVRKLQEEINVMMGLPGTPGRREREPDDRRDERRAVTAEVVACNTVTVRQNGTNIELK